MKKNPILLNSLFPCFFFLLLITSCSTPKNIAYFQDLADTSKRYTQAMKETYEVQIKPDDILEIIVNSMNADAAAPFNLGNTNPSSSPTTQLMQTSSGLRLNTPNTGNATSEGYLVDKNGTIDFPVLGSIKVKDLTISQLKDILKEKLNKYLQDPIINVRLLNYKVTVLGEVLHPATYSIPSERLTIVDAIGMAGDLTIFGKRENVLLIREENGQREFVRLNLNSSNIFQSPYYYLKQNDIVYVEPNKAKIVSSDYVRLRNLTILTSIITLLIVILTRVH